MTREEAINRIKDHMVTHHLKEPRAVYISEALAMAIKALEQEPETVTEFADRCKECGAKYGKLLKDVKIEKIDDA